MSLCIDVLRRFTGGRAIPLPPVSLLSVILAALAGWYLYTEIPNIRTLFAIRSDDQRDVDRAEAIRAETGFEDVVFTEDSAFAQETPFYLAHSMKRVYPAQSLRDILDKVKDIPAEYNVVLLHAEGPGAAQRNPELAVLDQAGANKPFFQDISLVRIPKSDFLEICRQRGVTPSPQRPQLMTPPTKSQRAKGHGAPVQREMDNRRFP